MITKKEALEILTEHTRNYISLCDMDALEVAIEVLTEAVEKEEGENSEDSEER